jgi:16S rRNA (guanine527-N7)-methyltransferase
MTTPRPADVDWPNQLEQGLDAMGLVLDSTQRRQLLAYLALLQTWNRAFNLTAVRDPAQMVSRQLLDSLSILTWVDAGPVLDIGTGAGLPGLPLAIACPTLPFTLLDSNGKKTRFVQQAASEIGLGNVEVLQCRIEELDRPGHYARITSRAFATLADIVTATPALLTDDGCWLAMKGVRPDAEIDGLPSTVHSEVLPLSVPGETAARHLVRAGLVRAEAGLL